MHHPNKVLNNYMIHDVPIYRFLVSFTTLELMLSHDEAENVSAYKH